MKKKIQKFLTVFFILALDVAVVAQSNCRHNNNKQELGSTKDLISNYEGNAIVVDAKLNEKVWKYANLITIQDDSLRSHNYTEIKTLWDEQNLYLAFEVQDKSLVAKQDALDHSQLFLDDMVEFLIDAQNDKDSCWTVDDVVYHINLLGQKKDDRGTVDCTSNSKWNGNAQFEVQLFGTLNDSFDIDEGYIIEVAISWDELNLTPFPGSEMGINFANGDNGTLFDWAGAWPFRSPYAFGNLILQK